jgi:hypothetical protein
MKKYLLILIILGTVSCNTKQASYHDHELMAKKDPVDLMKAYPELIERINKTESTPTGNYYRLTLFTDSTCRIEWGNKQMKKAGAKEYHFSIARRLHFDWENEDFLVLKAGTGSDSWFNVFLALDHKGQEETIENTLAHDKTRNLVVAESVSLDTAMVIRNLMSKKMQYVIEADKCSSIFIHYCIDSIAFTDKGLYYKWTLPNKLDDNPKRYERIVRIKI